MPARLPLTLRALVAGCTLATAFVPDLFAAGFALDFEGARALGNATAGSASAVDATTIFYNPAGMLGIARPELVGGGQLFLFHDRFSNDGSTILAGALPTPGTNGDDAIPVTVIPWMFGVHSIANDLAVGVGLFAPFGLRTDYGNDFVGRYQNQRTAITVLNFNPAIAWAPMPQVWLGAGATIEYVHAQLIQAIDFGSACVVALGAATCDNAFGLAPGRSDGSIENRGNDVAFGYSAGILLEVAPQTRIGASYRSRIDHHFGSLTQAIYVPPGARAFLIAGGLPPTALTGGTATTDVPLPSRLVLGARQMFADDFDLFVDATLTSWGVFRTTVITPNDPSTGAGAVIAQNYKDAWRFAIGGNYRASDRWEFRGGIAYDQTPIAAEFVQAALPDRDRTYFTVGTSYRFDDAWSADLGYAHVRYAGRVPIDRTNATGNTLRGSFDVGGDILGAQVKYRF
jgi:long-chain fatty acid transport protein